MLTTVVLACLTVMVLCVVVSFVEDFVRPKRSSFAPARAKVDTNKDR